MLLTRSVRFLSTEVYYPVPGTGSRVLRYGITNKLCLNIYLGTEMLAPHHPLGPGWWIIYQEHPTRVEPEVLDSWIVRYRYQRAHPGVRQFTFSEWERDLGASVSESEKLEAAFFHLRSAHLAEQLKYLHSPICPAPIAERKRHLLDLEHGSAHHRIMYALQRDRQLGTGAPAPAASPKLLRFLKHGDSKWWSSVHTLILRPAIRQRYPHLLQNEEVNAHYEAEEHQRFVLGPHPLDLPDDFEKFAWRF